MRHAILAAILISSGAFAATEQPKTKPAQQAESNDQDTTPMQGALYLIWKGRSLPQQGAMT